MTTKEAVEIAKETLKNYRECVGKNGDKPLQQALTHLIQIVERVDEERIAKILKSGCIASRCHSYSPIGYRGLDCYETDTKDDAHAIVTYLQGEKK